VETPFDWVTSTFYTSGAFMAPFSFADPGCAQACSDLSCLVSGSSDVDVTSFVGSFRKRHRLSFSPTEEVSMPECSQQQGLHFAENAV
jgi:hypothetical protein